MQYRISQNLFRIYCEKYNCIDACGLEKELIESEIGFVDFYEYTEPNEKQQEYIWFKDNENYNPNKFLFLKQLEYYIPKEILDNLKTKLDKILNE
jgi:hypothetical protein